MQRIDFDDEDAFEWITTPDGRKVEVLKDRHSFRVPMRFADSRTPTPRFHDGFGGPIGHRPGFIYTTDARAADLKERTYGAYHDALVNAHKDPVTGAGSHEFVGQQEGDLCTINGWPGHLRRVDGKLTCIPDRSHDAARSVLDAKAKAYETYETEITNAWRRT